MVWFLLSPTGGYLRGNSRSCFRDYNGDNPIIAFTYTTFFQAIFWLAANRSANNLLQFDLWVFDLGMDSKENTKSYLF